MYYIQPSVSISAGDARVPGPGRRQAPACGSGAPAACSVAMQKPAGLDPHGPRQGLWRCDEACEAACSQVSHCFQQTVIRITGLLGALCNNERTAHAGASAGRLCSLERFLPCGLCPSRYRGPHTRTAASCHPWPSDLRSMTHRCTLHTLCDIVSQQQQQRQQAARSTPQASRRLTAMQIRWRD